MIGLYVAFIALIIFGGLIIYAGNEVVQTTAAIVESQYPGSWTGVDALTLAFVTNWWLWLRLFLLLGGLYWLIVQTQRTRETGR